MKTTKLIRVALVSLAAIASASHAAIIPVTNASFELPYTLPSQGGTVSNSATGWTFSGSVSNNSYHFGTQNWYTNDAKTTKRASSGAPAAGDQYLYMYAAGSGTFVYQNLGVAIVAGNKYTLTAHVAGTGTAEVSLFGFSGSLPTTNLATTAVTGLTTAFVPFTAEFTATNASALAGNLGIVFRKTSAATSTQPFFDAVSVTSTPVPEPVAASGLMVAGAFLLSRRRGTTTAR